jgi:hypothetical protein
VTTALDGSRLAAGPVAAGVPRDDPARRGGDNRYDAHVLGITTEEGIPIVEPLAIIYIGGGAVTIIIILIILFCSLVAASPRAHRLPVKSQGHYQVRGEWRQSRLGVA